MFGKQNDGIGIDFRILRGAVTDNSQPTSTITSTGEADSLNRTRKLGSQKR